MPDPSLHDHAAQAAAAAQPGGGFFENFFQVYTPRQVCMFNEQGVIWLHIVSDILIAVSYYTIPLALVYVVRKRKDLAFNWMFVMFAVFIMACGTTHVFGVWAMWQPLYRVDGVVKFVTAVVSALTAVLLWRLIPSALALPSPSQLREANESLLREGKERARYQEALADANVQLQHRLGEIETRNGQLRTMTLQLNQAEQRERRRLSQVLHDNIQQIIAAARFHLGLAAEGALAEKSKLHIGEAEGLIEEALSVSRSLALELSPPVLYEAGLASALEWLGRRFKRHQGLEVQVEADPCFNPTTEDMSVMLFQIARELLYNIHKHAHSNAARIELADGGDGMVRLAVTDDGVGFDVQAGGIDMRANESYGLFNIRERMNAVGGDLTVHSQPGAGARITVIAPRHWSQAVEKDSTPSDGAPEPENAGPASDAKSIRVLLADDHRILREGLASVLREQGDIQVIGEASDGQMAVELSRRLKPDVVVMDLSMPRLNGIEATRIIAREMPTMRVIVLSMHERDDMAETMFEAGASAYIAKGGPASALVEAIRGNNSKGH